MDRVEARAWREAEKGGADWSRPLTWSLSVTGAKALALSRMQVGGGAFQMLGASAGAPAEFLYLCRDVGGGPCAAGVQERHVSGLGTLAWSAVTTSGVSVVLFGLYDRRVDLDALNEIARICERCVSARVTRQRIAISSARS
jgi:hypothetical protein